VRLKLLRQGAQAEVQLGEQAKFFPSDAALSSWMAQAHEGDARIVYD
jgi:DNA polymerase-3 subunit alpha